MSLSLTLMLLICFRCNFQFETKQTGAIFDKNHDERARVLRHAVHMANQNVLRNSGIILDTNIERISYGNTFSVSKSVCSLLNVSDKNLPKIEIQNRKRSDAFSSRLVSSRHHFRSGMVTGGCTRYEYLRCQGNSIRGNSFRWRCSTKAIGC